MTSLLEYHRKVKEQVIHDLEILVPIMISDLLIGNRPWPDMGPMVETIVSQADIYLYPSPEETAEQRRTVMLALAEGVAVLAIYFDGFTFFDHRFEVTPEQRAKTIIDVGPAMEPGSNPVEGT